MLNINIICLGKLKEEYLRQACAEYEKRLGAFCKLKINELAPVKLPDGPSPAEIEKALEKEGDTILSLIGKSDRVIAMCIEGKMKSSEQLAEYFSLSASSGAGTIDFIIGSSFGLCEKVKSRADLRLSMSPMTFPHQLARVMLLEQIYRACSINSGGKYHK